MDIKASFNYDISASISIISTTVIRAFTAQVLGSFSNEDNEDGDGGHEGLQKKYLYFTFKCCSCLNLFSRSVGLKTCSG